jgi:co-chaperonin GroES (HSP10)
VFKPTQDYLLVKPIERKQSQTLEVISSEKYSRGLVVAAGPGKERKNSRGELTGKRKQMDVKPGDFITYGDPLRGYDFWPKYEEDGILYRVLQQGDVCFISDRQYVDEHNSLTDAEIDTLIAKHNRMAA